MKLLQDVIIVAIKLLIAIGDFVLLFISAIFHLVKGLFLFIKKTALNIKNSITHEIEDLFSDIQNFKKGVFKNVPIFIKEKLNT